ncbi:MAG: putative ABC transporter permease, partial [Clostridia bacterium]|nr:putative ABC transporter permease [Clostridia bacterium]
MVKLVFLFLQGAVFGWIWETVYCTVKNKKWANRGFLYGPIVPIYGFGLLLAFSVYTLEERGAIPFLPVWTVFAAAFFISMVLEYFTSLLLEKLFHARWWDYSNMPLNIGGRTGVLTSLGFGAAGVPALRLAVPFLLRVYGEISFPLLEVFSFLAVMLLSADITLTVSALTDFAARVSKMDASFRDAME